MKNELIAALEKKGFNRWTKGAMDRLYINPTYIGLELEYYKTGNVSAAYLNGERISNTRGREMKAAKCYIDIATGKCVSSYDVFVEAMEQILAETEAELDAQTETAEAAEQSTMYIHDFTRNVFENSPVSIESYTADDAAADLDNFRADGWDVPEDLDAETLASEMNVLLIQQNEE